MLVGAANEVDAVLDIVWVGEAEKNEILRYVFVSLATIPDSTIHSNRSALPLNLPWSQTFYLCCQDVGGL